MQHQNSYMGNQAWSELDSVIYAMEAQNEPMGHMDLVSSSWSCDRAGRIKQNLPSGSNILISSGGGITTALSLADWAFTCDNLDLISVHDYGTDASATAATLSTAQTKAKSLGKTLLLEEWGATGDNKAEFVTDFAEAMKQYSIPWLYWEVIKPGQGSSNFEVWTDEASWSVLANGGDTGAINWSKRSPSTIPTAETALQAKKASQPALPGATEAVRFSRKVRKTNSHQQGHDKKQITARAGVREFSN